MQFEIYLSNPQEVCKDNKSRRERYFTHYIKNITQLLSECGSSSGNYVWIISIKIGNDQMRVKNYFHNSNIKQNTSEGVESAQLLRIFKIF